MANQDRYERLYQARSKVIIEAYGSLTSLAKRLGLPVAEEDGLTEPLYSDGLGGEDDEAEEGSDEEGVGKLRATQKVRAIARSHCSLARAYAF